MRIASKQCTSVRMYRPLTTVERSSLIKESPPDPPLDGGLGLLARLIIDPFQAHSVVLVELLEFDRHVGGRVGLGSSSDVVQVEQRLQRSSQTATYIDEVVD